MDFLQNNRFFKNLIKDKKLVLSVLTVTFVWALIYLLLFYKPAYKSESLVLIKDLSQQDFVAEYGNESQLKPLTSSGNPLLTQLDIIESGSLSNKLAAAIEKKYPDFFKKRGVESKGKYLGSFIQAKSKVGTDTLNISFKWENPEKAQELLGLTLEAYQDLNLEINKKIRTQRRKYIETQSKLMGKKLAGVREQIKEYKIGNLAFDVEDESRELGKQKVELVAQLENIRARIQENYARVKELESKLSLNVEDALDSVAIGSSNETLLDLRRDLNEAAQEYAFKSIELAYTNPEMVSLTKKIRTIRDQIRSVIKISIGRELENHEEKIAILDGVRENLVADLAKYQTNYIGLSAQEKSLEDSIKRINNKQASLPEKKYNLDKLEQEEKNLSLAFDQLRIKQIESRIKEAETVSNISVIDSPSLPQGKSFPAPFHIIFLSLVLGLMTGASLSVVKTLIEDTCEGADAIESITKSPVLGVIPWLKDIYDERKNSILDFSIKNIVSTLVLRSYKYNAKVLTFTSTYAKRSKSSSLVYVIAQSLVAMKQSVVVVDADLKVPTCYLQANSTVNLSNIILNNRALDPESILKVLSKDENGIYFLGNSVSVESPYEYICSTSFEVLIHTLREHFDWVLIDTPSANVAPEFPIIAKLSDAVILLANYKVTCSTIMRFINMIKKADVRLLGTIIREENSILEKDFEESEERSM